MSDSTALLTELGEVKGQLKMMTAMIQQNHESTHQRINDFRHAIEGRIDTVENRMDTMEKNERGTALRAAGGGAVSAAIVAGAIEAMKMLVNK